MKKNIHVVEDNDDIREVVEYLLVEEGYNFFGYESVKSFENRNRAIPSDMYVLDVMLPDGNGLNICNQLKANSKTSATPIMIMSANMDLSGMKMKCNANEYLKKPFDIEDFVRRIAQWTT